MRSEESQFLLHLGQRIRELRVKQDLSQEGLGFAAGRTQHYVSQVELGKRNVSIATLRAIAQALQVSLATLFEGIEA